MILTIVLMNHGYVSLCLYPVRIISYSSRLSVLPYYISYFSHFCGRETDRNDICEEGLIWAHDSGCLIHFGKDDMMEQLHVFESFMQQLLTSLTIRKHGDLAGNVVSSYNP